jgi:hypothetical protein
MPTTKSRRHANVIATIKPRVPTDVEKLDNYKRNYEFKKTPTNRSPVAGWEERYLKDHVCDAYCMHSKQEMAMINKTPSGFRAQVKAGKLRNSGAKGAHRIGARKR